MLSQTPRTVRINGLKQAVKAFDTTKASIAALEALYNAPAVQTTAEEFKSLQEPKNCTHGYFCSCIGCEWDEVDEIL